MSDCFEIAVCQNNYFWCSCYSEKTAKFSLLLHNFHCLLSETGNEHIWKKECMYVWVEDTVPINQIFISATSRGWVWPCSIWVCTALSVCVCLSAFNTLSTKATSSHTTNNSWKREIWRENREEKEETSPLRVVKSRERCLCGPIVSLTCFYSGDNGDKTLIKQKCLTKWWKMHRLIFQYNPVH